ncbi:hypothetical protein BN874_770045 [Candidatus Contendobacter odensis Run_B_J11]|uniref:Uncharacterized protein n=1 Tax=Candidatus Contendobacter odensis Run_B_J11 TaxID=1400861 RepID=A0A7U7J5E9_9GAMM|nr:hypothetical protein BN874_770045 [Candidatus Contendobacter odensis Run_B_J11]
MYFFIGITLSVGKGLAAAIVPHWRIPKNPQRLLESGHSQSFLSTRSEYRPDAACFPALPRRDDFSRQ